VNINAATEGAQSLKTCAHSLAAVPAWAGNLISDLIADYEDEMPGGFLNPRPDRKDGNRR